MARQLKLAFSIYQRYDRAVSLEEIHAEISDRLAGTDGQSENLAPPHRHPSRPDCRDGR